MTTQRRIMLAALSLLMPLAASALGDLTLRYDRPAEYFEETFVLGNGTQGAIVYGNPDTERISLNDITFWTGEPDTAVYSPGAYRSLPGIRAALDAGDFAEAERLQHDLQGRYTQNYQPVGNIRIDFADKSPVTGYLRTLDLTTATATVSYTRSGNDITLQYIASAPDSVIGVRITASKPLAFDVSFDSPIPSRTSVQGNGLTATGNASYTSLPSYTNRPPEEMLVYGEGRGIKFATAVDVAVANGTVRPAGDNGLSVTDTRDAVIWIAVATNFAGASVNPSVSRINPVALAASRADEAARSGFDAVAARHREDYASLFGRVSIDLGQSDPALAALPTDLRLKQYGDNRNYDPDLEELYFQFGRYLLISCSRTQGVPANLQGLWNEYLLPPWSSNYTANINLEENYWPAGVTNLSELQRPLLTFIDSLPRTGTMTAREYYGIDRGWCLGHNSDMWGTTNPVGQHEGDPQWANWNMGGAWLASHVWDQYLFTGDLDELRSHYPAMKGAAEFCLAWLIDDGEGNLITSPSTSPENSFHTPQGGIASTSKGGFADLAMIRQCLADTRDAAAALGTDPELRAEIDGVLPRLAPYRVAADGHLQEWREDYPEQDPQHRHQSHLYGLYPGNHITPAETPELAAAAARSLQIKGDNTTGWSTGWRVNLLARLNDAPGAYKMYRRLLRYVSPDKYKGEDRRRGGGTYPNLLDAHSPFQIDGNFGGTAGVAEMLIQSRPGSITLLPALPAEWKEGSFKGLRARGAYTVDAEWHGGRITSATVTSDNGGETEVHLNGRTHRLAFRPGESKTISGQ